MCYIKGYNHATARLHKAIVRLHKAVTLLLGPFQGINKGRRQGEATWIMVKHNCLDFGPALLAELGLSMPSWATRIRDVAQVAWQVSDAVQELFAEENTRSIAISLSMFCVGGV